MWVVRLAPTLIFHAIAKSKKWQVQQQALAAILKINAAELEKKMSKKAYMVKLAPEGKNISKEQADEIARLQIDGLYTGVDFVRHYPNGELLSRLIGFTGYDGQGLAGIEYAYDEILQGSGDKIRLYTDAKGIPLPHVDDGFKTGKKGAIC